MNLASKATNSHVGDAITLTTFHQMALLMTFQLASWIQFNNKTAIYCFTMLK